jgi:hypothetical protein
MSRKYDEGEVLRDLGHAGVKINQSSLLSAGNVSSNNTANSKIIVITRKARLGIKRLGKIDFLLNSCKGYAGVMRE